MRFVLLLARTPDGVRIMTLRSVVSYQALQTKRPADSMVKQTVYRVTNYHNALTVNIVNHFECEMEILYYKFTPTVGSPFLAQPCFRESLGQTEDLQTFEH